MKRLYYEAVLARYNVEIAGENRQMFGQLLQFNQARFEEGAIPEADLIKVRLERIKFDSALKLAQLNLRQVTIRLLERLGESSFTKQDVIGQMNFAAANISLESLRQQALDERPDIQTAMREVNAAEERLALERAGAVGEPAVGRLAHMPRHGARDELRRLQVDGRAGTRCRSRARPLLRTAQAG